MTTRKNLLLSPFQSRRPHRGLGLALLSAAAILAMAGPASAEIEYPWCMVQGEYTQQSCTYMTAEQCRASLAGAGYCDRNPRTVVLPPLKPKR
jgi:hypothetical protein